MRSMVTTSLIGVLVLRAGDCHSFLRRVSACVYVHPFEKTVLYVRRTKAGAHKRSPLVHTRVGATRGDGPAHTHRARRARAHTPREGRSCDALAVIRAGRRLPPHKPPLASLGRRVRRPVVQAARARAELARQQRRTTWTPLLGRVGGAGGGVRPLVPRRRLLLLSRVRPC